MHAKLDTYLSYGRTRLAKRMRWSKQEAMTVQVEILGGLHKGSDVVLQKNTISIGNQETDDIMLLDPKAAVGQVTIIAESTLFGPMIRVTTAREDVSINDDAITPDSDRQTFRAPCHLMIGEIPMSLNAETTAERKGLRPAEMGAILALSWVGILGIGFALNWGQPAETDFEFARVPQVEPVVPVAAPAPISVTTMLQEAGLTPYLSVVEKSEDAIAVVGMLPVDMKQNWLSVRRQIDVSNDQRVVFSEFQEVPSMPTIPAIALVRLGDTPSVIFADERVAQIGDSLADDWILKDITRAGLILNRHGRDLTIAYR